MDETLLQDFDTFTAPEVAPTQEVQQEVMPTTQPTVSVAQADPLLSDFDTFTAPEQPQVQVPTEAMNSGMVTKPTLDINKPIASVKNQDGTISTVRTIGVNINGKEMLIPTVHPDGYIMSNDEAVERYKNTGEHFGEFDSPESSTKFAINLHNEHESKFVGTKDKQIDQHRPQNVDDDTWMDIKNRVSKFLGDYTPLGAVPKMVAGYAGEAMQKEGSQVKEAMSVKSRLENIDFAYKDLADTMKSAVGDKEAENTLKTKQNKLNDEVVGILKERGIEAYNDSGKLMVVTKDKDGNDELKDLDENVLDNVLGGFTASAGEVGGAIMGAAGGATTAQRALPPMSSLPTRVVAGTIGAGIGGYTGATLGRATDLIRNAISLNKEIDAKEVVEKSLTAGTADVVGTAVVGAIGKGVSKAIEPLEKLSHRAWTLYKTGDIKGAVKVVKDDYKLSDSDIDALFKNVSKDVEGLDELQGDDLLRAKLLAVVQQQDQGEGLIAEAIKKTPKGAMETSKEIATRAKEVLKYAESMGSKPSAIKKSVQSYEKAVGENYGEVRGLIDEALPNYKPDLDLASFGGTLKELNTRVIDPTVKEKITNLAESLSSQKVETVGDLIETRQLFNRFYGKNQSHFESKVDKETLMSIKKSIDSKIDEAMSTLPDEVSTGLKNAFTDAKKQYEEMFKTKDTATYISIFGKKGKAKGKSEEQIGKALVKYSKAEDNDLEVVLSKLSPVQRVKSEFSIINELLSTSMGKTQAKSIDFNKLLEGINASKNTFKSDEAKQFIKNVEEFDKKFGKDVGLQKATEGVVAKEMNSIATSVIGKTKMLLASIQFKAIQRLAISDEGRRLSLQKSLEMALQKSRTPREFFFEASKIKGMPNSERIALKKAIKDIGVQEAKLKEQATIQATKNEEAIAKANAEKQARVAKVEAEARQRWEAAIAEKAQEMKNRKENSQAERAKNAAVVPIGGSEDEAKQAVKNVFAKTNKPQYSKADIAELDRLDLENEANQVFAKGAPELLSGTIAGVEQDEQGNITLDPAKFVMGVLGVSSIRGLNKAYKNSPKTQAKVEKALRSLAKDSTRVAGDMIEKINKQIGLNIEPRIVDDVKVNKSNIRDYFKKVEKDLELETFDVFETSSGEIRLNLLIAPKESQKSGKGTKAMEELIKVADEQGKRVTLSPALKDDRKGTTSRARLIKFYKRFGFVENKGRNKDFSISDGMYREPK
jgi:hypothetical protein